MLGRWQILLQGYRVPPLFGTERLSQIGLRAEWGDKTKLS